MKRLPAFICIFCLFSQSVWALSDSVQYSKDLILKDGFYITFQDFRANHPVPKSKIISNYDKNALDFFKQEIQKTEIKYIDSTNAQQTVNTNKLWGYCCDNNIYINYGREFSKIMVVGSICHFTAFIEVRLGGYGYYPTSPATVRSGYEIEQFIMDFKTGKIGAFNVNNMEILLKQGEVLYAEFMALKKKKKRDLSFFYLRKFNEKHPIYFRD